MAGATTSQRSRRTTPGAAKEEVVGTATAAPTSLEDASGDEVAAKAVLAGSADQGEPAVDAQVKRPRADSGMDIDEHAKKPKVQ